MGNKMFVSGNDAVALGVRLSKPHVIAAYPITPQTIAVERLADFVEDASLESEFMHVESEHSAMSASMGASAIGARTFTATSSQGLLYMAEGLFYAAGGRFPIVMMNANRSLALPWSIYGDLSDSLSMLNSGWIQVYVEDAQEALDMVIQAFKIAEHKDVLTPFMINLDGFILTHTYELIDVPEQDRVDVFLPEFETANKMSLDKPMNMGMSTTPADNLEFKVQQHRAIMRSKKIIKQVDSEFGTTFNREYGGLVEEYRLEDADVAIVCVGSITGTIRLVVDEMRQAGHAVGLLKLRYMRPFPEEEVAKVAGKVRAMGVIDKDISFGHEGTIFTHINSAVTLNTSIPLLTNFIGGMGGRDISKQDIENMFLLLLESCNGTRYDRVQFIGMGVEIDE
ncbi:pyruvate ferredoxin oxidoreductase [bacterium]|nr:pyruvate ferredoxin oxidoreductase [bacterium]